MAGDSQSGSMQGVMLSVLRIVTGFTFFLYGGNKLFGWFGGVDGAGGSVPIASFPFGVAGVLEVVGGALIILGLFTRPVAFVLAGQMAVAYFMVHAPNGFLPGANVNMGMPAVLFCFIYLYLAVAGAGTYCVDEMRRK